MELEFDEKYRDQVTHYASRIFQMFYFSIVYVLVYIIGVMFYNKSVKGIEMLSLVNYISIFTIIGYMGLMIVSFVVVNNMNSTLNAYALITSYTSEEVSSKFDKEKFFKDLEEYRLSEDNLKKLYIVTILLVVTTIITGIF